jgi:hypothetical protein
MTNDPQDDCPLPVGVQRRNICYFAIFWCIYYLAAPVSYVGTTHANLLKTLGHSDTVSNLPASVYLWLAFVPVLAAWLWPHSRYLKPLGLIAVGSMACATAVVALALWLGTSTTVTTVVVIGQGAVFGAASGVLLTALWDSLKRGVSTSRRGIVLGLTFGIGPLFACAGGLLQDAAFDGKLLGGHTFGLSFPHNYLAMFAVVTPLMAAAGVLLSLFTLPTTSEAERIPGSPLETRLGINQFLKNRPVWFAILLYVVVYSGGNGILPTVSLHARVMVRGEERIAQDINAAATIALQPQPLAAASNSSYFVLHSETDTQGIQNFLRFGCKALAGALLGWLLAITSSRATLLATTSVLLLGMSWAISSSGWWFMATFGILGAGELFGAYFPNYVTTASQKRFVRINMAYLSVVSTLVGFSPVAFGAIADRYSRMASFYTATGILLLGLILIRVLLPSDPSPREGAS